MNITDSLGAQRSRALGSLTSTVEDTREYANDEASTSSLTMSATTGAPIDDTASKVHAAGAVYVHPYVPFKRTFPRIDRRRMSEALTEQNTPSIKTLGEPVEILFRHVIGKISLTAACEGIPRSVGVRSRVMLHFCTRRSYSIRLSARAQFHCAVRQCTSQWWAFP